MKYSDITRRTKKKLFLTKDGLDKIKEKLDEMTARRLAAIKNLRLTDKRNLGELHRSAEVQQLENAEQKIEELDNLLQKVEPATDAPPEAASTLNRR